ncbi:MAG: hypothetical protein ACKOJF_16380, partial [Planctomycetaceae bacterium]
MQAKDLRGIRLIVNSTDRTCTGFQLIRPLPALTYVCSPPVDGQFQPMIGFRSGSLVLLGPNSNAVPGQWVTFQGRQLFSPRATRVRIPAGAGGTWFPIVQSNSGEFVVSTSVTYQSKSYGAESIVVSGTIDQDSVGEAIMNQFDGKPDGFLSPNIPIELIADGKTQFELVLGNEAQPMSDPVNLPSGVVIDLDFCELPGFSSGASESGTEFKLYDFMYTPRGSIEGSVGTSGPLFFLINDLQDALATDPNDPTSPLNPIHPRNKGEKLVLAVFPSTGNVQTFPIDPTDAYDNSTGAATLDGKADDLFSFARRASAAN